MKFHTIFLDMDGVIANFHLEAVRAHLRAGRRLPHIHNGEPIHLSHKALVSSWPKGKSLQAHLGLEEEHNFWSEEMLTKFWAPIRLDPLFWRKIEPMPWINELLTVCHSAANRVVLCTTPDSYQLSYSGKTQWIVEQKLDYLPLVTCSHDFPKSGLADPRSLLIDDSYHNCQDWCRECDIRYEKPGSAILFPAPWNPAFPHAHDPVGYTARVIDYLLTPSHS